ncbi:L-erythro-3,5-diaminohexanoate dehydrogenase [Paractinoplanes deccanensis]|uniref:L-erythro-3,5-diaminohexanoate dehydrogenase n=1 Tax=Paractinoplanes deccanensis TaxID=113561 RepID=A0ABQ3Y9W5_9ACTN|nr:L-erythro-3,5-diaminohexanoate dehydrogenase [Actinoplanes deccanensis]GID76766.1 L-erythro-3,5-diaminohexanoate dehydrogenase [Actinoplanes deccanensis]
MASVGLDRVVEPEGVLPQAAWRLDASPEVGPDEVRVRVERLNLDAASFRQLSEKHGGDGAAVRAEVLEIVGSRGKMHNPVTGSGGMLIGVVDEVGPRSPLGVKPGDRVATLVSLTLTPLAITDGLAGWDGLSEQVPAEGTAILFGRSIVGVLPDDLAPELALAVYDVCGAPALTDRLVRKYRTEAPRSGAGEAVDAPSVAVLGGAGKSGSLALTAARLAGARTVGIVRDEVERAAIAEIADVARVADARNPVEVAAAVTDALGGPATITVVCVDVPGCEHGAILATAEGGTVIFFSMATSFPAAALGAEGLAADVTMLIGNGYVPGHAAFAVDLLRRVPAVRSLFEARVAGH